MELCDTIVNFQDSALGGGVYFHPQVLAFGVHLPLSIFVHRVLTYYDFTPTQLTPSAWRTLLAFETLCVDFAPDPYNLNFITYYMT